MVDDDGGNPDTPEPVQRRQPVPSALGARTAPSARTAPGERQRPVIIDVLPRRLVHHPPPRKTPGRRVWFRDDGLLLVWTFVSVLTRPTFFVVV